MAARRAESAATSGESLSRMRLLFRAPERDMRAKSLPKRIGRRQRRVFARLTRETLWVAHLAHESRCYRDAIRRLIVRGVLICTPDGEIVTTTNRSPA